MIHNPTKFKGTLSQRCPIEWLDHDSFVLTHVSIDGTKTPIRYHRITKDYVKRVRAATNQVVDQGPQ